VSQDERRDELLWIGAFRYYCGRKTYAVADFVDVLIHAWPTIPERAQVVIRRDLNQAFADHFRALSEGSEYSPLGMDMDVKEWDKIRTMWREAA
jgi:hypothetical protein